MGIRAKRQLFLRYAKLKDWQLFVLDVVVGAVGLLMGSVGGFLIAVVMAAVVHFVIPWIGGHFILVKFAAQAPATTLKAEVEARAPEDQKGSP
jgi:hypothetical protein